MTNSKLTNVKTLELTQKLSERIKNQQKFLVQAKRQVEVLRQERQQLRQLLEQH